MNKKRMWLGLALGLTALAFMGCNGGDQGASGTTGATGTTANNASGGSNDKPLLLAFVTNNASEYWISARKGVEKAEKEVPNVKVDFVIPDQGTAAEQHQKVDDELARGVQGIAISPDSPENATDYLNSVAKKALLITQDSDAPKSDRAFYLGTDNVAAGKQIGEAIKKAIPGGGSIAVFVGNKDAQNAVERMEGMNEELKGSNIKVVDVRTDNADHAVAKTNASAEMIAHPELAGLVGLWSYNGPAILSAVKDAHKEGKIKIIAFDTEKDTVQGLKDGYIDATVVQQPFEFGEKAVQMMAAYLRGDKSQVPANKLMLIPTTILDKSGIDKYIADNPSTS